MEKQLETIQIKRFITWTVTSVVIFVAGVFLLNLKISAVSLAIQDQKSQIQAFKNRENNINQLQDAYYKIRDDIPTVTVILPNEENVASFVKYLEDQANKHSVAMEILFNDKTNIEVVNNKYLIFDLNLSGIGNNVKDLWKSLEKGPYFINISSFNFNTTSGLGSDTQLKLIAKVFTNESYFIN